MKKHMFLSLLTVGGAFGLLSVMASLPVRQAHAQGNTSMDFDPPIVFQAAGPTISLDSGLGRGVPHCSGGAQQRQ